uniref:Uncharacterized protein n=1 Tax=Arundo donax TaxID=35708 RepID=A0A0A9CI28_ARUDO
MMFSTCFWSNLTFTINT